MDAIQKRMMDNLEKRLTQRLAHNLKSLREGVSNIERKIEANNTQYLNRESLTQFASEAEATIEALLGIREAREIADAEQKS